MTRGGRADRPPRAMRHDRAPRAALGFVLPIAGAPAPARFGEAEQDAPPASAAGGAP
ncbi:hypothetical protein ABZ461_14960 [Actinacidiphila glaucinigra]|uniref:hypothetical protein n=1 Tax=Actinacidiphila glaucinigra TaxID=235986 RepID=UPI0033CF036A